MKIQVAVLFGGKSVEHEISIISAVQAIQNMDKGKYEILPVYITKNNELYYGISLFDIEEYKDIKTLLTKCRQVYFECKGTKTYLVEMKRRLFRKNKVVGLIDVAFPIVHGTNVEDGSLQGFLKTLNLPFVGCDVLASAICMDKYVSKVLLREAGIPVLDCLTFFSDDDIDKICDQVTNKMAFPVIVKPINLGSSIGISKANNLSDLRAALEVAYTFASRVLIEQCVSNLKEVNCSAMGEGKNVLVSECEEPVSASEILTYTEKYLEGNKSHGKGMANLKRKIPAEITDELKDKIIKFTKESFIALNCCGVVRIDYLIDTKTSELWLNEINSIPGSLAFYLWEPTGIKYPELLDRVIDAGLKRNRDDSEIIYTFDTNVLSSGGSFGKKGAKG